MQWIDDDTFATANEGDYVDADGVEGGVALLHPVQRRRVGRVRGRATGSSTSWSAPGHYPEARSENKGVEPEGLEVGRASATAPYLFVASERAQRRRRLRDRRRQAASSGRSCPPASAPRGWSFKGCVLAVSAEVDGLDEGFPARPFITFFQVSRGTTAGVPDAASATTPAACRSRGCPVRARRRPDDDRHRLWSVSDSYLGQAYVYRIDVSTSARAPSRSASPWADRRRRPDHGRRTTSRASPPGPRAASGWPARARGRHSDPTCCCASARDGCGRSTRSSCPAGLAAAGHEQRLRGRRRHRHQARRRPRRCGSRSSGEWADDVPGFVKIGRYDVADDEWTFAAYPLDPVESPAGGLASACPSSPCFPSGDLAVIERDNQLGSGGPDQAGLRRSTRRRSSFAPSRRHLAGARQDAWRATCSARSTPPASRSPTSVEGLAP